MFLFCATEISDAFKYTFKKQTRVLASQCRDAMEWLHRVPGWGTPWPRHTVASAKAAFAEGTWHFPKMSLYPGTPKGWGVHTSDCCLSVAKQYSMYSMQCTQSFFVAEKCYITCQVLWMWAVAYCSVVFPCAVSGARLLPSKLWLGAPGNIRYDFAESKHS